VLCFQVFISDRGLSKVGGSAADLVFKGRPLGLLTEAVVSSGPFALKIFSGLLTGVTSLLSGFCLVCLLPDASLYFSGVAK
jgi:hypothetical protein